jgi:DNA-binding beta-propeller fold protein YncE
MTLLPLVLAALVTGRCEAKDDASSSDPAPLALAFEVPMPGVRGRIDHLALDAKGHRLFVAALGNDTVEIVDLDAKQRVASLPGLAEPQGVAWLAASGTLVVTTGGGASATIFSGPTFGDHRRVALRDDPDNVRVDAGGARVWIGEGGGSGGALAVLDPAKGEVVATIGVGGHPESFQLEEKGDRAFVNVPSRREVVVVDRAKAEVAARYRLPAGSNFPMALDEAAARLYVASRGPSRLYQIDTAGGGVVSTLDGPGDVDELFLDASRHRLYAVAGAGLVRVFHLPEKGPPERVADVESAPGARTGLLDLAAGRLFVAAPRRGGKEARILVFETK